MNESWRVSPPDGGERKKRYVFEVLSDPNSTGEPIGMTEI
jgi:hypothetical protein